MKNFRVKINRRDISEEEVLEDIGQVRALSDLAQIKEDPYLEKLFDDEVAAVRTIGDFLRDFEAEHIERLNLFLDRMS